MSRRKVPVGPKSLTIGPFVYSVDLKWPGEESIKANHAGQCRYFPCEIVVSEDLNDQRRGEVLLHEALHGIFYNSLKHNRQVNANEETIVDAFGLGLIALMRANPDFMPYLAKLIALSEPK
jgi:hypothetical protein